MLVTESPGAAVHEQQHRRRSQTRLRIDVDPPRRARAVGQGLWADGARAGGAKPRARNPGVRARQARRVKGVMGLVLTGPPAKLEAGPKGHDESD
jgi:hypothetical protein